MYAVIETGGKQYRVQPGSIIQVEKLEGEVGSKMKLESVLFCSQPGEQSKVWLGKPYLNQASAEAEVVGQGRGKKELIIKMKRRKQYRRTKGHRQSQTQLLITGLDNGSGEKASLGADEKKKVLAQFQSHLTPIPSVTTKTEVKKTKSAPKKAAAKKAKTA